jgi:hypothetical protein
MKGRQLRIYNMKIHMHQFYSGKVSDSLTMHTPSKWHTRQLVFVVAYTQANINRESYMKLPHQDSQYQVKS